MINEERAKKILDIVKSRNYITITELCELLFCSRSTVRRDVIELSEKGLVKKIHGGVKLIQSENIEYDPSIRNTTNVDKKLKISHLIQSFIMDNHTYFIDSSSTCEFICDEFKNIENATVITNGLNIASKLSNESTASIFILGGNVKQNSNSVLDEKAYNDIKEYHVDVSFISCRAFSIHGIFDADSQQAQIRKQMLTHSNQRILLLDSSKFDKISTFKICDFDDITHIISDRRPNDTLCRILDRHGIKLIYS